MSKPLSFDANEYETSTTNDVLMPKIAFAGLMLVILTLSIAVFVSDDDEPPPHANKPIDTIIQTTTDTMLFFIFTSSFRKSSSLIRLGCWLEER